MSNIIDIGEFRFERKRQDWCDHKKLFYDSSGRTVQCQDCMAFIEPFQAFLNIANQIGRANDEINKQRDELRLAKEKEISLLSAKKVEKAWRSHSMVPICPHCHEAIFAHDRFGEASTNKQRALERRKFQQPK